MQNSETDKAVAKVIESAGKYAPELWTEMVAAARLDAIMAMVFWSAATVLLGFAVWYTWRLSRVAAQEDSGKDAVVGWRIALGISLLFGALCAGSAVDQIHRVAYPQAAVVQSILK